ncbi:MAG: hypothetical protein AB1483_12430 [Candidatus Zixiibacteriota bacterium]
MRITISKSHVYILIAAYAIMSILLLIGIDFLSRRVIDDVRTVKLKSYSEAGLDRIISELESLSSDVDLVRAEVASSRNRFYPNLREFEELCRKHNLKLERAEKVNLSDQSSVSLSKYNTTVQGTVGAAVRFLRQLEAEYIFSSEHVLLYPVDNEGEVIAVSLSLLIQDDEG